MDGPILHTKFYIPPAVPGELIARPRLTQRLDEAVARKLTLISAPAGYGKTTLVSQWLVIRTRGRGLEGSNAAADPRSPASSLQPPTSGLPGFRWTKVIMTRFVFGCISSPPWPRSRAMWGPGR